MPVVSVTKRQIKNVKTGTDITVPSYQSASSPRNVKDYHVVVISKLCHFKKPEHSEEDVIQFMVPRDYSAFEKLQKDLLDQFSELKLPDLPRKHILFMSDEDLEDRRVSFDCLMIIVSRSVELTTSIPMLEFLGVDLLADRKYKKRRAEYLEGIGRKKDEGEKEEDLFSETTSSPTHSYKDDDVKNGGGSNISKDDDKDLFGEDSEDLFGGGESEKKKTVISSDRGLFDDDPSSVSKRTVKLSLLDDEPELTILKATNNDNNQTDDLFATEDNSELLYVPDTLDDALKVAKDKPKPKPKKKPAHLTSNTNKSTSSQPVKSSLASSLFMDESPAATTASMGTDDITKYIQQNEINSDDDDLQLF